MKKPAATPSFRPLYEQIRILLTQSLVAGEWKPGESIPSEMELAARFRVDAFPNRHFDGRVAFLYPTVSSDTRTLKIRFALSNPGGVLRPGMYGRALVYAGSRPVLAVPAEAVVNAGEHSYAFLARAGGRFEPRRVTAGRGDGDWVPILSGLAEGDTVVASASFLIDSESRLRSAISGLGAQPGAGHEHGATP